MANFKKTTPGTWWATGAILIVLPALFLISYHFTDPIEHPTSDETFSAAEQFVRDSLKAPSTADFGSVLSEYQDPDKSVGKFPDGTFQVKLWVDAQNGFGAKIRTHFTLHMQYNGGSWTLLDGVKPDD